MRVGAAAAILCAASWAARAGDDPAPRDRGADAGLSAAAYAAARSAESTFDQAKRTGIADLPDGLSEGLAAKVLTNRQKLRFIKTMAPLILHVNERILRDRLRIEILSIYDAAGIELDPADTEWLRIMARRYRLKSVDFATLLRRVDIVPPSLALAQAAEESGWGQSRFAREGNALFGQRVYGGGGNGLVPRERAEGEAYQVRVFNSALQAVRAYKHNLNTHWAYAHFRQQRAEMRRRRVPLDGYRLAEGLLNYSERREAYLHAIRAIMRTNGLGALDRLQAAEPWPDDPGA